MASMNIKDRARHYLERLKQAADPFAEGENIAQEIDSLVWESSQEPLTRVEKFQIIEEIARVARYGEKTSDGRRIIESCDNSGVLEVIDYLISQQKD